MTRVDYEELVRSKRRRRVRVLRTVGDRLIWFGCILAVLLVATLAAIEWVWGQPRTAPTLLWTGATVGVFLVALSVHATADRLEQRNSETSSKQPHAVRVQRTRATDRTD